MEKGVITFSDGIERDIYILIHEDGAMSFSDDAINLIDIDSNDIRTVELNGAVINSFKSERRSFVYIPNYKI